MLTISGHFTINLFQLVHNISLPCIAQALMGLDNSGFVPPTVTMKSEIGFRCCMQGCLKL